MTHLPSRRPWRYAQLIATILTLTVGAYGMVLVASGFALIPEPVADNAFPLALRVHIAASSLALLLLPLQGVPTLRRRGSPVHRWVGRGYVAAAIIGGVSGTVAAFATTSGPIAAAGFAALGVAWVGATLVAIGQARRRRLAAHRAWALRSAALAFAAVTLRLELPLADALGLGWDLAYPAIAWLCWIPNLVVAQWLIVQQVKQRATTVRRTLHPTPAR